MLKRSEVEAALEKKGFQRREGDHSWFIFFDEAGKKTTVRTKTSHGTKYKDLSAPLVASMAKQLYLTKGEFEKFVECTLSHQQYEAKLTAGGLI